MKKITAHEMKRCEVVSTAALRLMETMVKVNEETGGLRNIEWLDVLLDVADSVVKEQLKHDWRMRK
jgi:hypothetical protein